jgi:translation initiation factor IF-1
MFKVQLEDGKHVTVHVSGHARKSMVRLLPGDRVRLELTAYDLTRGRIIRRYR